MMDECLFVTIMPTEGCNFRCSYCYESHRPLSMHRETLDQIQTYLVDQALRFQNLHLNWFGGEPTLCKDIILETCALVQEAQASHPFRYSGGMTTNGYLLDEDAFRQYFLLFPRTSFPSVWSFAITSWLGTGILAGMTTYMICSEGMTDFLSM